MSYKSENGSGGGWIIYVNNTKSVIIVQDLKVGQPERGKVVKIQPGETYRESFPIAGSKNIRLYDSSSNPIGDSAISLRGDTFVTFSDVKAEVVANAPTVTEERTTNNTVQVQK